MGSWLICKCGKRIHKNLFTGTDIYKVINDADYDKLEDPVDRNKVEKLFFEGVTLYRCKSCKRIAIEWEGWESPIFYIPENK